MVVAHAVQMSLALQPGVIEVQVDQAVFHDPKVLPQRVVQTFFEHVRVPRIQAGAQSLHLFQDFGHLVECFRRVLHGHPHAAVPGVGNHVPGQGRVGPGTIRGEKVVVDDDRFRADLGGGIDSLLMILGSTGSPHRAC